MNANSCSFSGEIQRIAERLDLAPDAVQVGMIEGVLQGGIMSSDDDGKALLDLGDGPVIVTDAIAGELKRLRLPQASQPSPAPQATADRPGVLRIGNGVQFGRHDRMADIVRSIQAGQTAATTRQVSTWPNPWREPINRTRQNVITNTNPALAARFKAEASALTHTEDSPAR